MSFERIGPAQEDTAHDFDQTLFPDLDSDVYGRASSGRAADTAGSVQHDNSSYSFPGSLFDTSPEFIGADDSSWGYPAEFVNSDLLFNPLEPEHHYHDFDISNARSIATSDSYSSSSHQPPWSTLNSRLDSSRFSEQSLYSSLSHFLSDTTFPEFSPSPIIGDVLHSEPISIPHSSHFVRTPEPGSLSESSPLNHGNQATGENNEMCPLCAKKFQRPSDLRRHMRQHESPSHRCYMQDCTRAFHRTDKLRDHLRQAHGIEGLEEDGDTDAKPSSFGCSVCGLNFRRQVDLNKHHNRIHNRRFRCPKCDRAFGLAKDLQRHEMTCYRQALARMTCKVEGCAYNCLRKDNLLRHIKKRHGEDALRKARELSEGA